MDLDRLNVLQASVADWQMFNFGEQAIWLNALGVGEEVGEFFSALTSEDVRGVKDAIGDTAIYAFGIATKLGLRISDILSEKHEMLTYIGKIKVVGLVATHLVIGVGEMQHCILKRAQKIRSYDEDQNFIEGIKAALAKIFFTLNAICWITEYDFMDILENTWEEVSKRDWTVKP